MRKPGTPKINANITVVARALTTRDCRQTKPRTPAGISSGEMSRIKKLPSGPFINPLRKFSTHPGHDPEFACLQLAVHQSRIQSFSAMGYDTAVVALNSPQRRSQSEMDRVLLLIQVSRPIIWPVLPLVYCLGLHAAGGPLYATTIVQVLTLTLPMNLIGCGLNDIFDYESDRRSTRRRSIWGAVVGDTERLLVWRAALGMMPLVILGSAATRNWDNFVATVSLLLVAWLYSVPPVRLKERPPLDSLANGLGYFLLPLVMGYSLGADPRQMPLRYYLLALSVCGVHALATAADYDADRAAGHRTLATVLGRRGAAAVASAAFFITWLFGDFHGTAVQTYISLCAVVSILATLLPFYRIVTAACATIYVGFGLASVCHLLGW
jgi:4-hydroxybenzoate polyprenyltransferase